jgi:hypothetical protein
MKLDEIVREEELEHEDWLHGIAERAEADYRDADVPWSGEMIPAVVHRRITRGVYHDLLDYLEGLETHDPGLEALVESLVAVAWFTEARTIDPKKQGKRVVGSVPLTPAGRRWLRDHRGELIRRLGTSGRRLKIVETLVR